MICPLPDHRPCASCNKHVRCMSCMHVCGMGAIQGTGKDISMWTGPELFTWVLDVPITKEQAMRCAKREPGRSWEAIDKELHRLGAFSPLCFNTGPAHCKG